MRFKFLDLVKESGKDMYRFFLFMVCFVKFRINGLGFTADSPIFKVLVIDHCYQIFYQKVLDGT